MNLEDVRKELDKYDNIIKTTLVLRMSLIPIVIDNKIKNSLPIFQGKREEEIYKNIQTFSENNGIDSDLLKDIYKLVISNAIKIEENILQDESKSIINQNLNLKQIEEIEKKFNQLDDIFKNTIPQLIKELTEIAKNQSLNLTELSSLYSNNLKK